MSEYNIAWCCVRHEMTREQVREVRKVLRMKDDDILHIHHDDKPWSETDDADGDNIANLNHWLELSHYDAVFGIFPMSSITSMIDAGDYYDDEHEGMCKVYVPISKTVETYDASGKRRKELRFLRWHCLNRQAYE